MKLSKRLTAVAAMVTPGMVLADIGTDHAYIPIDLVGNKVVPRAIAMDVNPGPLSRATLHIEESGLGGRISTRLSDGLTALEPGEAQSIVIAGMGGALTVRILQNGRSVLEGASESELILQPQSETARVRAWLWENGWEIVREDMVFEDGKYYPMMKASQPASPVQEQRSGRYGPWDGNGGLPACTGGSLELEYGPKLLEARHPVLQEFLLKEKAERERILAALASQKSPGARLRAQEIQEKLALTEEALARLQSGIIK